MSALLLRRRVAVDAPRRRDTDADRSDWVCETDPHNIRGINVKQAGVWQQNTDRVGYRDVNVPLSWYCLVPTQVGFPVRTGVNMDA